MIDYFERVEADIVLEKEVNMQKLVAHYQKLVERVHEQKLNCLQSLKTNKKLESELEAIRQALLEHDDKLKKLDLTLRTFDGDVAKWEEIQSQCDTMLEKTQFLSAEISDKIVAAHMIQFKSSTSNTRLESVCGHLELEQGISGSKTVSTYKMRKDLVELCNLSDKQSKLIYRASRDGFSAVRFHAKCDNHPRTLTIIKTTKGYIFGAYTSAAWDSSLSYKADPNAFIFSLINASGLPQLIPIKTTHDQESIFCRSDYGPLFGNGDIVITDFSNLACDSSSLLGGSLKFLINIIKSYQILP